MENNNNDDAFLVPYAYKSPSSFSTFPSLLQQIPYNFILYK